MSSGVSKKKERVTFAGGDLHSPTEMAEVQRVSANSCEDGVSRGLPYLMMA